MPYANIGKILGIIWGALPSNNPPKGSKRHRAIVFYCFFVWEDLSPNRQAKGLGASVLCLTCAHPPEMKALRCWFHWEPEAFSEPPSLEAAFHHCTRRCPRCRYPLPGLVCPELLRELGEVGVGDPGSDSEFL